MLAISRSVDSSPRISKLAPALLAGLGLSWCASPAVAGSAPAARAPASSGPAARAPAGRGPAAAQAVAGGALRSILRGEMGKVGSSSGAYVYDLTTGRPLFSLRERQARSPASVQKLYTTSTALLRFGVDATLPTTVLGTGIENPGGVYEGDLYLRGGGDPTFGSAAFAQRAYATGASVEALARRLGSDVGLTRVNGSVIGDESMLDDHRGGPTTGFRPSREIGYLSALAFDRGSTSPADPGAYAARRLSATLRAGGIAVSGQAHNGQTPAGALELTRIESPPMRTLVRLTNRPSDNFFAETLLKDLGARFGAAGSTAAGAAVVVDTAAGFGLHPRVVDGSGLSREDHTSPRDVVRLLTTVRGMPIASAFSESLAVAGRNGTLVHRMGGGPAQDRCRAKTGSLSDVSALAGYCRTVGGDELAFAFLMNRVNVSTARVVQDRMTATLARYGR